MRNFKFSTNCSISKIDNRAMNRFKNYRNRRWNYMDNFAKMWIDSSKKKKRENREFYGCYGSTIGHARVRKEPRQGSRSELRS